MTILSVCSVDDVLGEFRKTPQKLRAKFGDVLSHDEMALTPVVLTSYAGIQQAVTNHATFDARTQEAIALVVGSTHNCVECQLTHTVTCCAAGWTPEQAEALRHGAQIAGEERLGALLAVARQVVGRAGDVDEDIWRQALQFGWTVEELAELFTHVIANIFTGYFNHYVRVELDRSVSPSPVGDAV